MLLVGCKNSNSPYAEGTLPTSMMLSSIISQASGLRRPPDTRRPASYALHKIVDATAGSGKLKLIFHDGNGQHEVSISHNGRHVQRSLLLASLAHQVKIMDAWNDDSQDSVRLAKSYLWYAN